MKLSVQDQALMRQMRIALDELPDYYPPVSRGPLNYRPEQYQRLLNDVMSVDLEDDEDLILERFSLRLADLEMENERLEEEKRNLREGTEHLANDNASLLSQVTWLVLVAFMMGALAIWGWIPRILGWFR